jgi:hypothetical protein
MLTVQFRRAEALAGSRAAPPLNEKKETPGEARLLRNLAFK